MIICLKSSFHPVVGVRNRFAIVIVWLGSEDDRMKGGMPQGGSSRVIEHSPVSGSFGLIVLREFETLDLFARSRQRL